MSNDSVFSVAAVIVTYHPEMSLQQRLIPLMPQVQKVVIIDNTEDTSAQPVLSVLEAQGCHIIRNGYNAGIGLAQNQGVAWAMAQGCSWVLTLDDDTLVKEGLVAFYKDALRHQLAGEDVGAISTRYADINSGLVDGAIEGQKHKDKWVGVDFLISSGSFFSVATYQKVGGFREEFFLDWVDHDFCLKMRRCYLKNFIYTRPMFEHALGKKSCHRIPLIGVMITTNNHPAWRCYLIAYNLVVLIKENFFSEFRLSFFYITYLLFKFIAVLFFEQDKKRKLYALGRGLANAVCNKRASYENNINSNKLR